MSLGDEHAACPFCPRALARRAALTREVYVRGDGEEKPYRENFEFAKDVASLFLPDLLFSSETQWTVSKMAAMLPLDKWTWAKVFTCADHGEFFRLIEDVPQSWWSGAAPRIAVRRDGRMTLANLRFMICPAVIETAGTPSGFMPCFRVVEWNGCADGIGACTWTCPRHGTWGVRGDGTAFELEPLIEWAP